MLSPILNFRLPIHADTAALALGMAADCTAQEGPLDCRLVHILHILYAVAAVLGVVLVMIGVIAYAIYRRNRTRRIEETPKA